MMPQYYFDYSKGHNLSQIEHKILAFLLTDSQNELPCSIRVVAKELTTSTATIIRLCKKLGFSGYTAFTEKLRQEHTAHYPTKAMQSLRTNLIDYSTTYLSQYQQTLHELVIRDVTLFIKFLTTSQTIQLIGDDSDEFISYIASKLQSNGFHVLTSRNKDTLLHFETNLNNSTLIILFSKTQVSDLLVEKMHKAKQNKVPIIGFYGEMQLADFSQWFDAQFKIPNAVYDSAVIMVFDLLMALMLDSVE